MQTQMVVWTSIQQLFAFALTLRGAGSRARVEGPFDKRERSSSLLKNLEMESFLFLDGGCWGGAVELYGIFLADVGCTLTRGG
jgi:hypothetical protein